MQRYFTIIVYRSFSKTKYVCRKTEIHILNAQKYISTVFRIVWYLSEQWQKKISARVIKKKSENYPKRNTRWNLLLSFIYYSSQPAHKMGLMMTFFQRMRFDCVGQWSKQARKKRIDTRTHREEWGLMKYFIYSRCTHSHHLISGSDIASPTETEWWEAVRKTKRQERDAGAPSQKAQILDNGFQAHKETRDRKLLAVKIFSKTINFMAEKHNTTQKLLKERNKRFQWANVKLKLLKCCVRCC